MKTIVLVIIGVIGLAAATGAQTINDKKNVEKLCGCFDVAFKYAETFSPDTAYKFHDRDEISGGTELVIPIEVSDTKMVIQHLLVISDSMIIKHWREDWTYENPVIWKYIGDKTWTKEQLTPQQVKGKWTQTVWEVSDAPRYQGASEWINTDGKTFWQNTADAPLPRREYSIRSDYNILKRTNRLIISDTGWLHEQDNQKIIRNSNTDKLLVEEKGINSYKRIDNKQCAAAKIFWEKNAPYWAKVRKAWDDYFATHSSITLKTEVDGKALHDFLNEQARSFANGKIKPADIDAMIKAAIESFLAHDNMTIAQH